MICHMHGMMGCTCRKAKTARIAADACPWCGNRRCTCKPVGFSAHRRQLPTVQEELDAAIDGLKAIAERMRDGDQ